MWYIFVFYKCIYLCMCKANVYKSLIEYTKGCIGHPFYNPKRENSNLLEQRWKTEMKLSTKSDWQWLILKYHWLTLKSGKICFCIFPYFTYSKKLLYNHGMYQNCKFSPETPSKCSDKIVSNVTAILKCDKIINVIFCLYGLVQ